MCALVEPIATRTELLVVIHRLEARKPTNTGLLGAACLANSRVLVRGHEGQPTSVDLDPATEPLLLFPADDALPLTAFAASTKPITLIVPDGNWRQASKVRKRVAGLRGVPCVTLPADEPSAYRLRAEAHDHGLATIEAIARAMGVLEGPHVRSALEAVFRAMVERTLWARGAISASQVTGGIPPGAQRHDPRGVTGSET